MKKILSTLVAVIAFSISAFAQAPQGFNYQAVVRNTAGQLMSNRNISVRISILQGSATGTVVYSQEDNVVTNANGLFTLIVGENSTVYANINWANGPYFIHSEIDPQGGNNYMLSTTQKMLAVPYAHYADVARRIDGSFVYDEQDPRFRAWGYNYDSLQGAPTRLSQFINDLEFPYDSIQPSISGDTLFLGDTYVILPHLGSDNLTIHGDTLFVGDQWVILPQDETPLFRISGDTLYMGDQYVILPDPSINISGDTLYMGDQYVVLPNFSIHGDTIFMGDQFVVLPNQIPSFRISHDTIFMGDQYVVLPLNAPVISISGDTLYMGDQYVVLPDNTPNFRISGDTIFMGDQYVVIPDPTMNVSGDTLYMGDHYVVLPNPAFSISGDTLYVGDQHVVLPHYIPTLNEVLSVNNNAFSQIHNVYTPTSAYDAVNKLYVDSLIAILNGRIDSLGQALNNRLDSMGNTYQTAMDSMSQHIYNLEHPIIKGALPGIFSVSADTRVNFSQGNLQYRPRIKTWRFAEHQYDIAGSDNNNVYMQSYCTSWIDLFGYGTSSWDGGAGRFMPYETTTNNSEYTEATDGNDLTDFYANADWGYYNPIINGGNQMATWRTLTYSEWTYLLTQRPNASQLRGLATVVSTPGYVILPDNWQLPAGQNFVSTDTSYTTNVYNAANWAIMEAAGAVFLPAAGARVSSSTSNIGTIGNYWTASHVNGTTGYSFHIGPNACGMQNTMSYSTGCSVRVVHEY